MLKNTHPSVQRVVIVHSSAGTFAREVATGAQAYCHEQGFSTVSRHAYPPGSVDFIPLLREMNKERPHLLLGVGYIEDDLRLAAQLVQNPLGVAAVALIATPMQLFQVTLGDAAQGFLGPSQWEPGVITVPDYGPSSEEVQQSCKRYATGSVDYPMAQAYAGCLVAQRCVEVAGSLEPGPLRQVAGQLDFTTFYGRYTIDPDTGCQLGHMMPVVQWHGGTKVVVWPPTVKNLTDTRL